MDDEDEVTEGAGARIAVGVGVVALIVVLAIILERVTDREVEPGAGTAESAPTELQFCFAWQQLSSVARSDRSSNAGPSTVEVRDALEHARDVGYPLSLSTEGRAGFRAAADRFEADFDPSYAPTAYPAEPDEDAAFRDWLDEHCRS
jgi:hypothetical protein